MGLRFLPPLLFITLLFGCGNPLGHLTTPLTESPTHATSPLALIAQKPNHHYAMNETGGTTAFDSGSGGVNATITTSGSVTKNQPGRYGRSFSFSGTGRLTPSSAITLPSQWTITFWIKLPLPAVAGARSIVNGPSLHHALFIGNAGNEYGAWISPTFYGSGIYAGDLSDGWHHFATIGTATSLAFYLDGRYISSQSIGSTANITAICGNGSAQYCGNADEIAIFKRALSEQEIYEQATEY